MYAWPLNPAAKDPHFLLLGSKVMRTFIARKEGEPGYKAMHVQCIEYISSKIPDCNMLNIFASSPFSYRYHKVLAEKPSCTFSYLLSTQCRYEYIHILVYLPLL